MARFAFDTLRDVEMHDITTSITLDLRGAHIRISGIYLAPCGCAVPVNLKLICKGKCNEDAHVLGLIEDMIRAECREMEQTSSESALLLSAHLVSSYVSANHCC